MSRQSQTNTFNDGMNKDLTPIPTPNTVMTDCLNGTIVTYNGNEFALQNDLGNYKFSSSLNPGYVPVGVKEYANTLYIISYNPIDDKVEIGSFPSMKTINTSTTHDNNKTVYGFIPIPTISECNNEKINNIPYVNYTVHNQKYSELYLMSDIDDDFKLYPGDKYIGVCNVDSMQNSEDVSHCVRLMNNGQNISTFVLTDNKKLYNIDKGFDWQIGVEAFKDVSWDVPGYIVIRPNINVMDNFDAYITDFSGGYSKIKLQSLWACSKYNNISNYLKENIVFLYRVQGEEEWSVIDAENGSSIYGSLYTSVYCSGKYNNDISENSVIEIVPALKVGNEVLQYGPYNKNYDISDSVSDFFIIYDQFKVVIDTKVQKGTVDDIKLQWFRYHVSNYQGKKNNITFNIGLESQYNTSCLAYYKTDFTDGNLLFKYDEVGNQIVQTKNFNENFTKGNKYYMSLVFLNTEDLESLNGDTSYNTIINLNVKKYESFEIGTTYAVSAFSEYDSFYNISETGNGTHIILEPGITLDNAIEGYLNQSESISVEFTDVSCNTIHNIQKKANDSWLNSEWKDDYLYSKDLETEEFRDYYKSTIYTNTSTPTVNVPYGEANGIIGSGIGCSINYINFKDKIEEKTVNFSFIDNSWTSIYEQEKKYRITYDQQDNIVVNIPVYSDTNISGYVSQADGYIQINSVGVFKAYKKSIVSGVKPNLNKNVKYKVDKNKIIASRDNYYAEIEFDQFNKIWKVVDLKIQGIDAGTNNGFNYTWFLPKIDNFEDLRDGSNEGNNSFMARVALCWCSGRDHEGENKWFDANGEGSNRVFGSCYPDATGVIENQTYKRNYLTIIAPNKIQTSMPVVIPYKANPQSQQYDGDGTYALNVLCEYLTMCNSMVFINGSKTETYYKPFLSKSANNIKDNITLINPEISISINIGGKTYNIRKNKKEEFTIKLNTTIYDRDIVPDNNNIPSYNFTVKKGAFKDEKQEWYNDYYTLFSDSNAKVDATSSASLQFRLTDNDYKSFAVFSNMYLRNE